MKTTTYIKPFFTGLLMTSILFIVGCKKEQEIAPTPFNEITSFKLPYLNGQDTLIGVIEDNIISIWWPTQSEYPIPPTVNPVIDLSANATVFPASKESVQLIDGLMYNVTAQDGSTRSYRIKLTSELPAPPAVAQQQTAMELRIGEQFVLDFDNIAADGSDKIYLKDANNNEYQLLLASQRIAKNGTNFILDELTGKVIPTGAYFITIKNKFHTSTTTNTLITIKNEPAIPFIFPNHSDTLKVKRGDVLTIPVRHLNASSAVESFYFMYDTNGLGNFEYMMFPYLGTNTNFDEIRVEVANDAPIGIVSYPDLGIMMSDGSFSAAPYNPYPIKIVE